MVRGRIKWYAVVQLIILIFTMSLMLSKHYILFENIFSMFYNTNLSIISVVFGSFSVFHGLIMIFRSLKERSRREFIEAIIVIAAGAILLSPEFNTILVLPVVSLI
jgi:uncharacterized membrane protein HdeD (DUF308 family)